MKRRNTLADFWAKVTKTPSCWIWTGGKTSRGYGVFTWESKYIQAHKFSWELHFGEVPKKMILLHKCDNPACVNPAHLSVGTHLQNVADRHAKGRTAKGEVFQRSQLTEKQVLEIRALYKPRKVTLKRLGIKYGVTESNVCAIIKRQIWKHI